MAKARHSNEWTESDAVAEVAAADPSDFVLETFPPEYVKRISQFIDSSSVSQIREDGAAGGEPAETDSDSADSLFITQKPVPEAVRSERRKRHSLRSASTSRREREESEDDSSPSTSPQDTRSKKRKKKIQLRTPKYSFPFLKDKMPKLKGIFLSEVQNTKLHYSSMGAFFDCMRTLQQSYQTVEDLESTLPAIDVNGECISPISEGEGENLGDEDMKVVAKKHFVIPSKVRHSQSWYSEKNRKSNSGGKMPVGGWGVVLHKIPTKKPSSRTAQSSDLGSSDDEDPSCRTLREKGTSNKRLTRQSARAQTERLKTNRKKRDSSEEKEKEDELSDDSSPPQSPKECTQKCSVSNKEELSQDGQGDSEPEDQSFFQSDTSNAATCSETSVKKKQNRREDNESAEEDDNESQEEGEVQYAAASMDEEITEVEESPHPSQTISELELNEKNGMEESDSSDSEQRKKKKDNRENENTEEEKSQSQDELEDQLTAASVNEEITEVEETQHLSQIVNELDLNAKAGLEDSDVPDSQQKKVKEDNKENKNAEEEKSRGQEELEDQHAAASVNEEITEEEEETSCLSQVASKIDLNGKAIMDDSDIPESQQKKKKKKKKKSPGVDVRQEVHESDVWIGEHSVHLVSCNTGKEKKKKYQKDHARAEEEKSQGRELEVQRAAASVSEEIMEEEESDIPHSQQKKKKKKKRKKSPEEHETTEKEKKKKKRTESNDGQEEDVEQLKCNTAAESLHDDVEIPTKKKKKKKGTEKKKEFEDGGEGEDFKNTEAFQENLEEFSSAKRKKHKKSSQRDEFNTPEDEENPQKTENHDAGQLVTKKKKREMSSREGSIDTVAQSSELLSVQRKKKKRKPSFLSADAEGKAAHSVEEKHCPSQSVAAEKPGVSTGSSAESAKIPVSLDESNDRVKKKKKKRKMSAEQESVEKDLEPDFEELKETCEDALSDTGVKKKKKKRKRNETESATPVKGSESAGARCSDEAVVLKKKSETESESLFEHASPSLDTPGKDSKKKKKGKSADNVSVWSKADCSFTAQLSESSELASPHSSKKNKPKKLKRTLHNPSVDFLTDSQYQ